MDSPSAEPSTPKLDNDWAIAANLSPLFGFMFPMGHIFAPLIIHLCMKPEDTFSREHAKATFHFQLSLTIILFALGTIGFIPMIFFSSPKYAPMMLPWMFLGGLSACGIFVYSFIMMMINVLRASRYELPSYRPIFIRLLK